MKYIYVGKLQGTHGLKGEIKLNTDFKYLDRVLLPSFNFYIGDAKQKISLLKYRNHNKLILMTFKDYEDISLVETFKNKNLYVLREDLNLKESEYAFEDYIDLEAYFGNKKIGIIQDIVDCGNKNYVFVIGDILIPMRDEFIEKVILDDRVILKDVEGLLDAN